MPTKHLKTGDQRFNIDRNFITAARRRAQVEAWMWRYHTGDPRDGWREHAACRGIDIAWFYCDDDDPSKPPQKVLDVCAHCPVRLDCGKACAAEEQAVDPNVIHGTRAGMTARTRWKGYRLMIKRGLR